MARTTPQTDDIVLPDGTSASAARPRRAAIVGTGHRARMYTTALARRPQYQVAALADPNPTRMAFHNRLLEEQDQPAAGTWHPDRFTEMLRRDEIDTVVVTTVDRHHDEYITTALGRGCRVVTEKPMTVDAARCRRILDTVERTGNHLSVTFNYRFNPVHERVARLLAEGAIGDVLSVHFEWLLDVRHGADYFRRWHREKVNSGGLMVHKSGHHFDLVNWWLRARPVRAFGMGRLGFYGRENGERTGYHRPYERAHGSAAAADDPFALHLADDATLRGLYLDAEPDDGYLRDRNVFGDGITIEDDMSVLVEYDTGATMTYHLTAYAPWEGYRVMFNGTRGRLELEVEETPWQPPRVRGTEADSRAHGGLTMPKGAGARIVLRPLWEEPHEVPADYDHEAHGGADPRMLTSLFGPQSADEPADTGDAAAQRADETDGAMALAVGLAANESFTTGKPVMTRDLF